MRIKASPTVCRGSCFVAFIEGHTVLSTSSYTDNDNLQVFLLLLHKLFQSHSTDARCAHVQRVLSARTFVESLN